MGTDIISWRQRIGVFMCSPRKLALFKVNSTSNLYTHLHKTDKHSGTCKRLPCFIFLATISIFLAVLSHNEVPLRQIADSDLLSSPTTTGSDVSCHICPFEQRTMFKHLHTSSLLIIAESMDVHPNPGPTAIHILKDFTSPEQRVLLNKVKRIQLKITRYERHEANYKHYCKHKIIPKGLVIKCTPTIDSAFYEQFNQQWKELLTSTSHKMIRLLKAECQKHLRQLRSEFNCTLERLRSQCSTSTFTNIKHFLSDSAAELSRVLNFRHRKKLSSAGECASLSFARTRHNNSNLINHSPISVNSPHSSVTITANDVNNLSINVPITLTRNRTHSSGITSPPHTVSTQPTNDPIVNTPNHSTPARTHRRRRKRKTKTNKYWRRDNHNIQLDTNAVINLSSVTLTHEENQLLARGLSFSPTPRNINWTEVRADFHEFSRRMRLLEYFHDYPPQTSINPFRNKSSWTPPPLRDPALDTFLDAVGNDLLKLKPAPVRDNLTGRERHACKLLSRRSDIVIKSADKGSGTVIMDRDWYTDECLRQLNDTKFYKPLNNDITKNIHKRIVKYTKRMNRDKIIDDETRRFLVQTDPKPGRFYILPKVHKQGNPGRPIVSSNSHPTERISQFVDHHLKPLVQTTQSFVKDTTHFLNKLEQLDQLPNNALLVTLDVSSLYTNIPHTEGINACRHFLDTRDRSTSTIRTETLCDLILMILTMNNFTFNDKHYLQVHGTAMGTRMAPSYANLFLAKFETDALRNAPFQPHTWWRYIDDIFIIWTHSVDDLHAFTSYLNSIHPTIKFTSNYSHTSIPFLDVNVLLKDGKITTDLYTKPTDKHQYLLHSSCHPTHTKRAIPFSLALRLRRICSSDETFKLRTDELKSFLNKRGYNLSFLNQEIDRVRHITRTEALKPKDTSLTNQPQRVPLVITYNPALRNVSSIIHKHFNILSSSLRSANVFKAKPIVAFRRSNNLSNILVSAKLRKPTTANQPHGSFRCGNNCLTCNYISDGLNSYTFNSTGETRLIKQHIDCNSKNVIYMIQCNRCHKQYIGETKRRLKDRFNEHRRPVDKQTNRSTPTTVSEHFLSNNHLASDMQLIPLELMLSNRDSVRKTREAYLIERGQTLEPLGLNKKEET